MMRMYDLFFFFSSRRRHTSFDCDWSSDVCSSDLQQRCRCGGGQRWTIKPRVHTARQGKGGHKVPVEAVSTDQVKDFVSNLYRTHGDDGQSVSIGKLDLL